MEGIPGFLASEFSALYSSNVPSPDLPFGSVKALVFDVFGTVVDWRGSIIRDVEDLARRKNLRVDAAQFADAWRAGYAPTMNRVRTGELPWTKLDALHRRILDRLLVEFGLTTLSETEIVALNLVWHRLQPWPDAVGGLTPLKKKFVLAPLSNGNLSLLTDLARYTLVDVTPVTRQVRGFVEACRTQNCAVAALEVRTIDHGRGARPAIVTFADNRSAITEVDGHTFVEHVQRAFPQTFVAERFAVTDDAALDLVHLGEPAVEHGGTENLAPHTAGAIGDDGLGLEVGVFAALEFGDEIVTRAHVGDDGILESTDAGFEGV